MDADNDKTSRLIAIAEGLGAGGSDGWAGIQSVLRELQELEPGAAGRLRGRPPNVLATARWGLPSRRHIRMEKTGKRADKLRAKGREVDNKAFARMLELKPDAGITNVRKTDSRHWMPLLGRRTAARSRSRPLASRGAMRPAPTNRSGSACPTKLRPFSLAFTAASGLASAR